MIWLSYGISVIQQRRRGERVHNGLEPPEIDMLKEQNETTEQESNLFAVMDEHIPSPPEIEAEDVTSSSSPRSSP